MSAPAPPRPAAPAGHGGHHHRHHRPSERRLKARRRLLGVAFLLVLALLLWLSVAVYQKKFTPVTMVTLYTSSAGNEMHTGAQVMVRGVQVGEVRQITADGSGARMELAIDPGQQRNLPANVTAQMLPTTLFGERYVDLVLPAHPAATALAAGSVISQDRSADALELERVLNNLLPMLQSLEPDKLSVTLTAIAQGLSGRGGELGHTLTNLNTVLRHLNPQLPALDTDIKRLAGLTRTYNQAAPSILSALNNFSATSQVVAAEQASYASLLSNVTTASNDIHAFLDANAANAIHLSSASIASLQILAQYAPEFPCTLSQLANFIPSANRVLGAGTHHPGLHVTVTVVPRSASARYRPGKDAPRYGDNLGPHCYRTPFPGIHLNDGTTSAPNQVLPHQPPPPSRPTPQPPGTPPAATPTPTPTSPQASRAQRGLLGRPAGVASPTPAITPLAPRANGGTRQQPSASQRDVPAGPAPTFTAELARELAALSLRQTPQSLPDWSPLLVAPLYEGATVRLGATRS
jgi:phospholipid/cholesterol/gamma-HCH transport system substrate-binding protein